MKHKPSSRKRVGFGHTIVEDMLDISRPKNWSKNAPRGQVDWDGVDNLMSRSVAEKPEGSFTVHEYAAHRGWGLDYAYRKLREAFNRGKLERSQFGKHEWAYKVKEKK